MTSLPRLGHTGLRLCLLSPREATGHCVCVCGGVSRQEGLGHQGTETVHIWVPSRVGPSIVTVSPETLAARSPDSAHQAMRQTAQRGGHWSTPGGAGCSRANLRSCPKMLTQATHHPFQMSMGRGRSRKTSWRGIQKARVGGQIKGCSRCNADPKGSPTGPTRTHLGREVSTHLPERGPWGVGHQARQWVSYANVDIGRTAREGKDGVEPMVLGWGTGTHGLLVAEGALGWETVVCLGIRGRGHVRPGWQGIPLSQVAILLCPSWGRTSSPSQWPRPQPNSGGCSSLQWPWSLVCSHLVAP